MSPTATRFPLLRGRLHGKPSVGCDADEMDAAQYAALLGPTGAEKATTQSNGQHASAVQWRERCRIHHADPLENVMRPFGDDEQEIGRDAEVVALCPP
jgi:hypothetical protein